MFTGPFACLFMPRFCGIALSVALILLAGCGELTTDHPVTAERIINADSEPGNWLSHGRTYDEQRFSPLAKINDGNVADLGLAWHFDIDTNRAMEATPLIADGVMHVTAAWSVLYALDAGTGALLVVGAVSGGG